MFWMHYLLSFFLLFSCDIGRHMLSHKVILVCHLQGCLPLNNLFASHASENENINLLPYHTLFSQL